MIPAPLEAVVFDMDGLLLNTEALYRTAIFEACARVGHEMADALHLSFIGAPKETSAALLKAHFGPDFPLQDYYRHCRAAFERLSGAGVPLKPGARELLIFLKDRGVPRGVATSSERDAAEDHLKRAGVRDLLDVLVARTDVASGKPHPETFLTAAARLGANPARCLALEDSHNGVRAASAAGMATIMVPDMLEPTIEIRALCVGVLESLDQVQEALAGSRRD
jgi:HAD superfamily hydrolase (TIGR01509 family)